MFNSYPLTSGKSNGRSTLLVTLVITLCFLSLLGGVFGEEKSLLTEPRKEELITIDSDSENSPYKKENNELQRDPIPSASIQILTKTVTIRETLTVSSTNKNNDNNHNPHPPSPTISDYNQPTTYSASSSPSLDAGSLESTSENNLHLIINPIKYTFSLFYHTIILLFKLIHYILIPAITVLKGLYTIFIWKPFTLIRYMISIFYPIYCFCFFAAVFGFFVGGTAGCFSEIIVGILTDSSSEKLSTTASVHNGMTGQEPPRVSEYGYGGEGGSRYMSYFEQEQLRRQVKAKRRAAALANLRARNGGKLPEEFYERLATSSSQLHLRLLQQQRLEDERSSRPSSAMSNYSESSGVNSPHRFASMQQRTYVSSGHGD
ncbi:796_t:CDS:1 [Ambispora leptoticha]|uniref:796_t:CDS:1 n=1 Tax=Ambispora leptoticha TaxID=144679 RepID=A0A9N9C165_9GLOM|nr:796_t:CDS:1 [Ambispora leptoticha]